MKYIKVRWKHSFPDEPVLLYSELDDDLWELRKVEVFRDGRYGYASRMESNGTTHLGLEPLPPLESIAADPQFEPFEITSAEFENIWSKRKKV